MPELPEVEVTRLGIAPHIEGRRLDAVEIRNTSLRWPVPDHIGQGLIGYTVETVSRRGKFILIRFVDGRTHEQRGTMIVHLGMTGSLRILNRGIPPERHDHADFVLGEKLLRFRDPRRFGAILWHPADEGAIETNRCLQLLGVEPLTPLFARSGGRLLFDVTRGRTASIKQVLLAGQIVVGVGNIYASESLFRAGISPLSVAGRIGLARYRRLAGSIQEVLAAAIQKGGSTLRDFVGGDGVAGRFQLDYFVYGRAGKPCLVCGSKIRLIRQGQRSSFYCPRCQK